MGVMGVMGVIVVMGVIGVKEACVVWCGADTGLFHSVPPRPYGGFLRTFAGLTPRTRNGRGAVERSGTSPSPPHIPQGNKAYILGGTT
jgi:hypothetical protein